jgi:hypothetical protein
MGAAYGCGVHNRAPRLTVTGAKGVYLDRCFLAFPYLCQREQPRRETV